MVRVIGRPIEVQPDEVVIGNRVYSRAIEPLQTSAKINSSEYVLNTWGDGNFALSMSQQFNGLELDSINQEATNIGQALAKGSKTLPLFKAVNLALRSEGAVYDAAGNIIQGERLQQLGRNLNNARIYFNDAFEEGNGFRELDLVHITGFDGQTPITERQPLERYHIGWADVRGEMNSQGYFTESYPNGCFKQGESLCQYAPVAGRVAGLVADPVRADVYADWVRHGACARLGGILCAEGTPQEIEEEK